MKTAEESLQNRSVTLYFDGTSRPNPGKSACAYIILNENSEILEKYGRFIGEGTNNIAEYMGFILGLIACLKYKPDKLRICADSNLLIQQINGNYKVKDRQLHKLHLIANEILKMFHSFELVHVPHNENKAHAIVQKYLEESLFDA